MTKEKPEREDTKMRKNTRANECDDGLVMLWVLETMKKVKKRR